MHLLWVILIGFVIGTVAKFFVPGNDPGGFIKTTLLGIGGSWVGGWLWGVLGLGGVGFIGSVIGAVIILVVYHALRKKAS